MNLGAVFLAGLFTGGITCAAVQGGLLATALAGNKRYEHTSSRWLGIGGFLISKLFVHIIFGAFLGGLGSVLFLSVRQMGWLQLVAAAYMCGVALAMLDVHPFFRRFLLTPPRWLGRRLRSESKSGQVWAPILLGVLTVLIPCGATQAIMTQAITTGNAWSGAVLLAVFVVGTMPMFTILGMGFAKAIAASSRWLPRVAGLVVLGLGLWNINSSAIVLGSPVYAQRVARSFYCTITFCPVNLLPPVTQVNIQITGNGYRVDRPVLAAGKKITLHLENINATGCQQAFTIPSLNVSKIVGMGKSAQVEFVAPDKPGILAYSCGMGMYPGEFTVVN